MGYGGYVLRYFRDLLLHWIRQLMAVLQLVVNLLYKHPVGSAKTCKSTHAIFVETLTYNIDIYLPVQQFLFRLVYVVVLCV